VGKRAKTVVVTHQAPHRQSVHARHENDVLTAAYASDLCRLMGNACYLQSSGGGYMIRDGSMENDQFNPRCVVEV